MKSGNKTLSKYLVDRSRLGDIKAQNELYNLYVNSMYNICRRMMADSDEAKDVLQEAFIHAFTKLHTLQDQMLFPAWIKRIVINHCLNALKKRQLDYASDENIPEVLSDDEDDFMEENNFKIKQVLNALDRISEGCRTVLNLYVFEGYSHKEISQILSITESASKAQYSKAKSKIRQLLMINT